VTASQSTSAASRPWPAEAVVNLYAGTLVALGALAAGWWGASGADHISHQLAWLNVAAAGVVAAGTANVAWLLRGRRALGLRTRLDPGASGSGPAIVAVTVAATGAAAERDASALFALTGLGLFHRPGCPMLAGRPAAGASEAVHSSAGRLACGVCTP
jgi:hypothetical protein